MAAVGYTGGDPRKLDRSGYTKGDVLAADASGDLTPVPVGADTEVLTADSTDPEGVDWQPGGGSGGPGIPSNTVVAETTYGQASTAGAAAAYSRGDHTHGSPPLTATPPATALSIGTAAAVGVAATPARADHVHPVAGSGTPTTSTVGDTATQGAAGTFARSDHTHGREGFGLPADSLVGDTQNAGVAATVARSDHRHARESFGPVTAQTSFGLSSSNGAATSVARSDHTHGTPAAPTIPGAGGTVVAETSYGQTTAVGVATAYARQDHTHGTPSLGTTATTAAAGNDPRLSDARTPLPHAASHTDGGTDQVTLTIAQTTGLQAALDGKQPLDTDLTAIAALTPANDDVIQRKAGAWANRTMAQLKTDLAISSSDVGAVPTSRTISTTAPLTGGGDLTADRTLGVDVGTTAGTVAAGDDTRIVGAQQRSTLTTKGDLYAATGPGTVVRVGVGSDGQVLTADSAQATGVRWAPAGGGAGILSADSGFVETGNLSIDNTAFVQLGPDLTVDAASGDILEINISVLCSGAGGDDFQFEAATRVAGTDTNWWSSGTGTSRWPGGVPNWYVQNSRFDSPHGNASYITQAGDIVAGQVTVRLYGRATGASARTIFLNSSYPLRWHLTNLGAG